MKELYVFGNYSPNLKGKPGSCYYINGFRIPILLDFGTGNYNLVKQKIDLLEKMYFHNLTPNGEMLFDCIFPKSVNPTGESIHEVMIYMTVLKRYNLKIYKAEDIKKFSLSRKQY